MLGRSPRARWLLPILLVGLVGFSAWRLWLEEPPIPGPARTEFHGQAMGTTWSVTVATPLPSPARTELERTIRERLAAIEGLMSTWDPESELSRFNRSDSTRPFPVSAETLQVLRTAREVSELTGGAFDVTVGPLVTAWGFGASDRVPAPPTPDQLDSLRDRVGFRLLTLDPTSGSVAKAHPETVCDLSAIAKGFGVDEVARALLDRGESDFLVEIGGEVRSHGERPGGGPWRVAIERPEAARRTIHRVVELRDMAMATSGDYRNFYEHDGVRLSHLIDPRSARPIAHPLASVTVVHPSATRADALATALSVLGPDEGHALAQREGIAAYFVVREPDEELSTRTTAAFAALTSPPAMAVAGQPAAR